MTLVETVSIITAAALQLTRLLGILKPAWNKAPDWLQPFLPIAVLVLPQVVEAAAGAKTWGALVETLVMAVVMFLPGAHTRSRDEGLRDDEFDRYDELPPSDKATPARFIPPGAAMLALCLILPGCAAVKPAVRTVWDVAHDACALFYGEKKGISFDEAARAFCATEDKIRPFFDEILAAQQRAGAKRGESTP